jgi:hypothetical protein
LSHNGLTKLEGLENNVSHIDMYHCNSITGPTASRD